MGFVISAQGISKRYRVGRAAGAAHAPTLRDALGRLASTPLGWLGGGAARHPGEEFWALRDVGVEVRQGETVGVVGRNGAGKSTLLKILSLVTRPTAGRLRIAGRVGCLLEVGVGFHPELSGRENVYLSGAVLGMARREIHRRLDEIVAFAGVEEFLDTPVKRYSSGMLARLGFAVSAHLDAEILLVDEALSVGDLPFQARCAARVARLVEEGRTVIFVSHSLATLSTLCRRGLLLDRGRLAADGPLPDVVAAYLKSLDAGAEGGGPRGAGGTYLVGVDVYGEAGESTARLTAGRPARFAFRVSGLRDGLRCVFAVVNAAGQPVVLLQSHVRGPADVTDPALGPRFVCDVDPLLLLPGHYRLTVRLAAGGETLHYVFGAASFEVVPGEVGGRPVVALSYGTSFTLPHRWSGPV
jgi:lipopolysaccharide transport system ATP-binding protein